MTPGYIQHNPLIPDGAEALGKFLARSPRSGPKARVVVDKIIAVGDYVFAHVNFLNLFNDDPEDTGIAGVDIYKMDSDGRALEHWDTLQPVGDPKNSAPWLAPNVPRANHTACSKPSKENVMTYSMLVPEQLVTPWPAISQARVSKFHWLTIAGLVR